MSYTAYRQNKIESGQLYQDFVVDCCWNLLGLAVVQYTSKAYQHHVGESKTGVEIKHDEWFARSGNLWIETAEKAVPRPGPYAPSGIYRSDNTWLYVIGDYDTIFIFGKRYLQMLHQSKEYEVRPNNTGTSLGFLLSSDVANKTAIQILYPKAREKLGKIVRDLERYGRELHNAVTNDPNQLDLFRKQERQLREAM